MTADPDDTDGGSIRRGGGPPGGSAFLSSRLRRSREQAEAAAATADVTPSTFAFGPFDDEPAFTSAPAAPASPASADPSTPGGPNDTVASPTTTRNPSFPGGRVRLPRLGETNDTPDLTFVGTAFVRRPDDATDDGPKSGFEGYFTYESLFSDPIAEPLRTESVLDGEDPYEVLGVSPDAPWREIVAAHRKLVKTHHPDRLVDASPEEVATSEEALRLINRAYSELRRRGRDTDDDA